MKVEMNCIVLYCIVLYCIVLYCIALRCVALRCVALRCVLLYCIALHCIALHCIALHCIALHCIALHCNALHCIVLWLQVVMARHLPGAVAGRHRLHRRHHGRVATVQCRQPPHLLPPAPPLRPVRHHDVIHDHALLLQGAGRNFVASVAHHPEEIWGFAKFKKFQKSNKIGHPPHPNFVFLETHH